MKKLLTLILAAALALSLAACGGSGENETESPGAGTGDTTQSDTPSEGGKDSAPEETAMTKEEMLEVAEEAQLGELSTLISDNVLRAKQAYCGKVLTFKWDIYEIKEDSIVFDYGMGTLTAFLPEEDILKLETGQVVTIVGQTGEEFVTTTESRGGGPSYDYKDCVMEQAYLVQDTYEYVGIPDSKNSSFPGAWDVEFPNSANPSFLRLVYFDESVDVEQYKDKEITFSARAVKSGGSMSSSYKYYDAVVVSEAE